MDYGFALEKEFAQYFNNRAYGDLSEKWKKHLGRAFPGIKDNVRLISYKYGDPVAKGDIIILRNGYRCLLSIKTGKNPSVHMERFCYFQKFLEKCGISSRTISIIRFYHYGVSKKLGNSDHPLTKKEIVDRYGDYIYQANEEINKPAIINKVVRHCVIVGRNQGRTPIDYFYYGNLEKGLFISRKQLYNRIKMREGLSREFIHFGELVYQPSGRKIGTKDRQYTRIHWPNLSHLFYAVQDEDDVCGPLKEEPKESTK